MVPESASMRPAMMLKIVVLPQPLGPMMLTKSRALMSKERSSSTRTSPALPGKDFLTLWTLSWAGPGAITPYTQLVCHSLWGGYSSGFNELSCQRDLVKSPLPTL
jgi:hypothetical protein